MSQVPACRRRLLRAVATALCVLCVGGFVVLAVNERFSFAPTSEAVIIALGVSIFIPFLSFLALGIMVHILMKGHDDPLFDERPGFRVLMRVLAPVRMAWTIYKLTSNECRTSMGSEKSRRN